MTKKQFTKAMKELIALKKAEHKISDSFKVLCPDFNFFSLGRYETLVVSVLETAMDDEYDWISYWLYEWWSNSSLELCTKLSVNPLYSH